MQRTCQRCAARTCIGQALRAGARIGVARVDQQSPDRLATGQMFAAQLHRGRAKTVLGEYTRHSGARIKQKNREVAPPCLADTGLRSAYVHPRNGQQGFRRRAR